MKNHGKRGIIFTIFSVFSILFASCSSPLKLREEVSPIRLGLYEISGLPFQKAYLRIMPYIEERENYYYSVIQDISSKRLAEKYNICMMADFTSFGMMRRYIVDCYSYCEEHNHYCGVIEGNFDHSYFFLPREDGTIELGAFDIVAIAQKIGNFAEPVFHEEESIPEEILSESI